MPRKKVEVVDETRNIALALKQLCEEKGLPRSVVVDAMGEALKKAYFKYSDDYPDTVIKVDVDLETGNLELAKLSIDTINYSNVTEMEFTKLVDNIKLVKDNVFVINGYMITDKDRFKLFESKSSYEENSSVGEYFTITWKDKFNYTGNANVTLECKLNGTYKLKDCVLVE